MTFIFKQKVFFSISSSFLATLLPVRSNVGKGQNRTRRSYFGLQMVQGPWGWSGAPQQCVCQEKGRARSHLPQSWRSPRVPQFCGEEVGSDHSETQVLIFTFLTSCILKKSCRLLRKEIASGIWHLPLSPCLPYLTSLHLPEPRVPPAGSGDARRQLYPLGAVLCPLHLRPSTSLSFARPSRPPLPSASLLFSTLPFASLPFHLPLCTSPISLPPLRISAPSHVSPFSQPSPLHLSCSHLNPFAPSPLCAFTPSLPKPSKSHYYYINLLGHL